MWSFGNSFAIEITSLLYYCIGLYDKIQIVGIQFVLIFVAFELRS